MTQSNGKIGGSVLRVITHLKQWYDSWCCQQVIHVQQALMYVQPTGLSK
jgi:hypothetical protein